MSEQLSNTTVPDGTNAPTVDTGAPTPQEAGKTFTQEQVNAFVQDRLARERAKYEAERSELETRATVAEQRLVLRQFGISEDNTEKYLKLASLYPNAESDFGKSLAEAVKEFPPPKPIVPRFVAPTSGGLPSVLRRDPVREGMGLNKKE